MTEGDYSLRWRLMTGTAGLLLVVLLLLALGVWQYASHIADLSYDRLLNGSALSIIERIKSRGGEIEVDLPYAALEILSLTPEDKVYYQVIGPGDRYLTGYRDFPAPDARRPVGIPVFYDGQLLGEPIRAVSISKQLGDPGISGEVEVRVGQSRVARDALTREIMFGEMLVLVLVMLVALACLAYGIHRTLRPLNRLSRSLLNRQAETLTPLPATAIREVQPLVGAIELYRGRLQANLDAMQLFIADASHQIRTALSSMQAQLDMARMEKDGPPPQRIEKVWQQHQHLSRLTNQLLTHALVAHRRNTRQYRSVNLDALLNEVLLSVVRDHAHSDIEFEYRNQTPGVEFRGDKISLREALRNLLDNAIKYGPADNTIILGSALQGSSIVIFVEDRGPGIPEEQQTRVLQRFERLAGDSQGSGLGLAIVKTVVESHGGTIALINTEPSGLRVELRLRQEGV